MPPAHRSSPVTIFSCVYLYDGFIPVHARTYTRSCLSACVRTRTHTSFIHITYIDIYIHAYIPVYIYIRWVLCAPGVGGSKDKAEESMHVLLRILSRSLRVHTQVHLYVHAYLLSLSMHAFATLCPQEVFAFCVTATCVLCSIFPPLLPAAFEWSRAHAQLVRAPVRASFSLPPPLYPPVNTYQH